MAKLRAERFKYYNKHNVIMLIISDASTLILLEKIGLLERLVGKFKFVIPPEVYKEAIEKGKEKNAPDAYALERKFTEGKISVEQIENSKIVKDFMLKFGTERGETETIALHMEKGKGIVAVDDRKAMTICNIYGVPFTTTLSLVLISKDANIITTEEAKKMITQLSTYGRYKDDLINKARKILDGEKNA